MDSKSSSTLPSQAQSPMSFGIESFDPDRKVSVSATAPRVAMDLSPKGSKIPVRKFANHAARNSHFQPCASTSHDVLKSQEKVELLLDPEEVREVQEFQEIEVLYTSILAANAFIKPSVLKTRSLRTLDPIEELEEESVLSPQDEKEDRKEASAELSIVLTPEPVKLDDCTAVVSVVPLQIAEESVAAQFGRPEPEMPKDTRTGLSAICPEGCGRRSDSASAHQASRIFLQRKDQRRIHSRHKFTTVDIVCVDR